MDNSTSALVCVISASRDKELREALENHLTLLVQQKRIRIWNRQQIPLGDDMLQTLATHFGRASIILLLMSADFIVECSVEMELATSYLTSTTIIPILLRAVDLQDTPFKHLQCLPRDGTSIAGYQSQDEALKEVAQEIRNLLLQRNADDNKHPVLRANFDHLIVSHTQLFAGREGTISDIHKYITDNLSGYIFIEGLSGYGKTSLLAKIAQHNPEFAYHFISQAYRTYGSDFNPTDLEWMMRNLCEQLERNSSEDFSSFKNPKDRFHHLLRTPSIDKARVIIIDAVDEIDRHPNYLHGVLPAQLPSGVFLIFSARKLGGKDYLAKIGLQSSIQLRFDLPGLGVEAIQQLLRQAGGQATQYYNSEFFIQGLYSVSEGDPFYLRFLIEDVADGIVRPDTMASVPSGLEAYLDKQFEILARSAYLPQHRALLGVILGADDSLARSEYIDMANDFMVRDYKRYGSDLRMPELLDGFNFDEAMRDIRRFFLEYDGMFTFCHKRFKEYFSKNKL